MDALKELFTTPVGLMSLGVIIGAIVRDDPLDQPADREGRATDTAVNGSRDHARQTGPRCMGTRH